ncbi:uncharacterized protein LACBIDRAFT_323084 [Laccaria bicolor S238N-H82]|uniref:Predicted protein n=1 Tax=Laccaria bicolor (strain S238N-H82 / ATCC MYA-4686) TaxID=486041 RepID=B0CW25_LACBS|nr:uncharacterized protein LACBIDRAFT_323084 [Laccaria bicolor S238N-H82]EDR13437.1 predicted protein [Laccaria bicolor S238N-H82]|eukprot:XP_001875935.1 predicted protein [Laccaria bicolor S238N-H82]
MIILEDVPRTHFVPKFNRRKALGCGPSLVGRSLQRGNSGWGKMKDWTEALMNFREEMSTLGGEGNSGHSAANIDVTLLRSISSKLKHGKALVSVTNIEAAGLLLRAIWKGYWSDASNKENVIDFLTKADHKPLESLGDLDIDAIRQPIKDFHRLNLPIHVAGFLSPLGLITGVPLCSRDYDRYSIFLVGLFMWRALGNMQPILLRCVEKLLWHAIISVAQGQETGHSALVTFLAQVPWEKLGSVQDSERRWFHAVEKKEMRYLEEFDDIDIKELPLSWPLRITEDGHPNSDQHHNPEPNCCCPRDRTIGDGALDDSHGDQAPEGLNSSAQHHNPDPECCDAGNGMIRDDALDDSHSDQTPEGRPNSSDQHHNPDPEHCGDRMVRGDQAPEGRPKGDQHRNPEPECCGTGDQKAGNGALGGRTDGCSEDILGDLSDLSELSSDEDVPPPVPDKAKRNTGKGLGRPSRKTPTKSEGKAMAITGIGSVSEWPIDEAEMERLAAPRPPLTLEFDKITQVVSSFILDGHGLGLTPYQKYKSPKQYLLYGPHEDNSTTYIPSFHAKTDLGHFDAVWDSVLRQYTSKPDDSIFWISTHNNFKKMSHGQKQDLMRRKKVLVITGLPMDGLAFDEDGMSEIGGIDVPVDVQDQSIPANNGDYNVRLKFGTLRHLLASASSRDGRTLNALNFPLAVADAKPDGIASDLAAWIATENTAWCNASSSHFPSRDVRWGLAGNTNAIHYWHIDSDGFGTFVEPLVGEKLWLVARPLDDPDAFSRTNIFSVEHYNMEGPNTHIFAVEAMLLVPGTRLYMPPNTPHWVLTVSHAICHGGHFYSSGSIRETAVALYRAFASGGHLTNTTHAASRVLLRRLGFFWHSNIVLGENRGSTRFSAHVPDITMWEGVLDLLSFCALMELLNVVDQSTYEVASSTCNFDSSRPADPGMSPLHRLECIAARRISREMLLHFFTNYELLDSSGRSIDGVRNLWWKYLGRQVKCLVDLKLMSLREGIGGAKDCTKEKFQMQIALFYKGFPHEFRALAMANEVDSFSWPKTNSHQVRALNHPKADVRCLFDLSGLTGQDRLYFQAVKNAPFKLEPADLQPEADLDRMEVSSDVEKDFESLPPLKRAAIHDASAPPGKRRRKKT